jgi:predicted nuclease of restriction endonuclease-like (RecB) superfamily
LTLLEKLKTPEERLWYAHAAIEHGWSRNVLVLQIESGLYKRQGKAITNFQATLPAPQSDLARQLIKDPYNFDFLTLTTEAQERDLERGLLLHLRQFLIELGTGFAFVGSQVPLEVGGEDFKLDLLFYHLKLRCFCVIDLKMTPFKPECRQDELLPRRRRRLAPTPRRPAEYRPDSLQNKEPICRGVCSTQYRHADGHFRVQASRTTSRAAQRNASHH